MPQVRIAILSDDRLFCEGLQRIIAGVTLFEGVGIYQASDALTTMLAIFADVLLMDSRVSKALELCASLRRERGPAVILVAAPDDDQWASEALVAGARGIMVKSAPPEDLVMAVQMVHEGLIWARRRVLTARIDWLSGDPATVRPPDSLLEQRLSVREREVFRQAAKGIGNKELADRLEISEATVKAHLTHIFLKLGLRGRAELAAAYHGVISPAVERA